jgi:uncharacterized membrane protein
MSEPSGSAVPWAVGQPLRSGWLPGAILLLLPALLLGPAGLSGPGSEIDRIVRLVFAPFCHQQFDRSLLFGHSLAVCARCAGFYAGLALVAGAGLGLGRVVRVRPIGLLGLLPLLVDGGANRLGLWASPAPLRALTGVLAAVPLALLVLGGHDEAR